jgi:hypothetical protein
MQGHSTEHDSILEVRPVELALDSHFICPHSDDKGAAHVGRQAAKRLRIYNLPRALRHTALWRRLLLSIVILLNAPIISGSPRCVIVVNLWASAGRRSNDANTSNLTTRYKIRQGSPTTLIASCPSSTTIRYLKQGDLIYYQTPHLHTCSTTTHNKLNLHSTCATQPSRPPRPCCRRVYDILQ